MLTTHKILNGAMVAFGFLLSGCATPLEKCISSARNEYNATVNAISVAQGNVARGYAINSQEVPYMSEGSCYNYNVGYYSCMQTSYRTEETPVSIDVSQERQKIAAYSSALPNLKRSADAATTQCQQQYPEK